MRILVDIWTGELHQEHSAARVLTVVTNDLTTVTGILLDEIGRGNLIMIRQLQEGEPNFEEFDKRGQQLIIDELVTASEQWRQILEMEENGMNRRPSELHRISQDSWATEELVAARDAYNRDETLPGALVLMSGNQDKFTNLEGQLASIILRARDTRAAREAERVDLEERRKSREVRVEAVKRFLRERGERVVRWDHESEILSDLLEARDAVQELIDEVIASTKPSWIGKKLEARIVSDLRDCYESSVEGDHKATIETWVDEQMRDRYWTDLLETWAEFVHGEGKVDEEKLARDKYPDEWQDDNEP